MNVLNLVHRPRPRPRPRPSAGPEASSSSSNRTHSRHQSNARRPSQPSNMLVFITVLIVNACIAGTIPATPENITVTFLTPTTVRVSWQTMIDLNAHPVEKYIVTYKPADDSYRVMQDVAGNSEAIILDRLSPSTQYSIAVTAVWLGKKYRSRQIIFRTLDLPKPLSQQDLPVGNGAHNGGATALAANVSGRITNGSAFGEDEVTSTATNSLSHGTHRELPTIRGVEIGIVLIVLMVWAGAIALFFNRWGKIRMLLPYQPDYKHEQLKVPGTGVCSGGVCNGQHSHQFDSSECGALAAYQPLHCSARHIHVFQEEPSTSIAERCTRSRINSAIFVSSEGKGFDSIEFLRRHGSQSVLCRKAKSAENITDNGRKRSFAEKHHWHADNSGEGNDLDVQNGSAFELQECPSGGSSGHPLAVLKSNAEQLVAATSVLGHSAAVTTSNKVVGSISIEPPPAHLLKEKLEPLPLSSANTPSLHSASLDDSVDAVDELVGQPTENKPRVLVRQRTSMSSPAPPSPHSSPKALSSKRVRPKISALPMVSISGPSPMDEKPPPSECL